MEVLHTIAIVAIGCGFIFGSAYLHMLALDQRDKALYGEKYKKRGK
jgi:hypothetical protein